MAYQVKLDNKKDTTGVFRDLAIVDDGSPLPNIGDKLRIFSDNNIQSFSKSWYLPHSDYIVVDIYHCISGGRVIKDIVLVEPVSKAVERWV